MDKTTINKPKLISLKAVYEQEVDCNADSDDVQTIEISTEDSGGEFYFVLKTDRWAIDEPNELIQLLENFKKKLNE